MAVLRTRRLGHIHLATANTSVPYYTVPAGHRAVLRDLWIQNFTGTAAALAIAYLLPSGDSEALALFRAPLPDGESHHIQCDTCLEAGDQLGVYSDRVGLVAYASGAELVLPV